MNPNQKFPLSESLAKLAKQLAKGDGDAISKIYDLTYTKLFYFGLQIAGNHEESLVVNVINDLFIWLAKNYRQVDTINNMEGYLYQSVRRNIQQKLQGKQKKEKANIRFLKRTQPNQDKTENSPEFMLLKKEKTEQDKALLDHVFKELPTYQKEVLYLRFYENRNYKDIAAILSINAQVARNYVHRALTTLRKKMNLSPFLLFFFTF